MFLDKKFIGSKFREYRKNAGFSQEKISELAEIAEKHYGRLERGDYLPSLETFFKLVEILNIPFEEFGIKLDKTKDKPKRKELLKRIYLMDEGEIEFFLKMSEELKKIR